LLRQIQRYQVEYNDLITDVGEQLIADTASHTLSALVPVPSLASVQSEWAPSGRGTPSVVSTGPKHVRFVYLALDPIAIGTARSVEAYRDLGGVEWKPFYPDPTPIHLFVQQVVTSDALAFTSDAVDFGDDLLDHIGRAWDARQIVVLVIDAWSLQWDAASLHRGYQAILNKLDTQNAFHWCVLIPWNEKDADLSAKRPAIEDVIGETFPFHGRLTKNPMFYRDEIKSFSELKTALTEVLTRLREEIRRQAQVTRSVPAGPSKP
jgi:FxsC-like protein